MGRDVTKGDLSVFVLAILAEGGSHGYAVAREIERRSGDRMKIKEGTLYPALRVLEQSGWIEGRWEIQASGPARKVYSLTQSGHVELSRRKSEWKAYAQTFGAIVGDITPCGGHNAQPA